MAYVDYGRFFAQQRARSGYQPPAPAAVAKPAAAPAGSYGGLDPGTISHKPALDYGQQIMTQALDPQQELYNRQRQQLQQSIMAANQARGLNMSGVGAGIEAEALGDFAIDWQDRLLKRSTDAAAAYGGLAGLAQNIAQTGFQQAGQLGASQFQYGGAGAGGVPSSTSTYSHTPAARTASPVGQSIFSSGYGGSQAGIAARAQPSVSSWNANALSQLSALNQRRSGPGYGWKY